MSTALDRSFTVGAPRTTNGTFTDLDCFASNCDGRPLMHSLVLSGSGAVDGVLTLYRGTEVDLGGTKTIVFDQTAAATVTVSGGTNQAGNSTSFEVAGCEHWRGVLSGLSASTTARWVVSYGLRS